MENTDVLLKIAEQLMESATALEKLANSSGGQLLRTEPTMPTPVGEDTQTLPLGDVSSTPEDEVIDRMSLLDRFQFSNPLWNLDADAASDVLGVPKNTVAYLADKWSLPHAMTTEGGRGPGGRRRVYSATVCVGYLAHCYSLDSVPAFGVRLMTSPDAAKILSTTAQTVGKWARAGRLPFVNFGHRRHFFPSDVTACKEALSNGVS